MFLGHLFWLIFFNQIFTTLLRKWAVPQSAYFRISYSLRTPSTVLMCLFVHFLIIPRAPTITETVVILSNQIFFNFYFHVFVPLILLCSFNHMLLSFVKDLSVSRQLFLLSYLPTPPLGQDITQGQFLSGV